MKVYQVLPSALVRVLCSAMLLLAGCSGGGTKPAAPTLTSMNVTPGNISLAQGMSRQFTVTGIYSDNTKQDLTAAVTWNSSDSAKAEISNGEGSKGRVSSIAVGGPITITATDPATRITGSAQITITKMLVSLALTPADPAIIKGLTKQFTAIGTYADNTTQDLTTKVTWSTSDTAKAIISNTEGSKGLASSVDVGGPISISATDPMTNITGITSFTVTNPASLVSLAVTQVKSKTPRRSGGKIKGHSRQRQVGTTVSTKQYLATGTFSDGSTRNLTELVIWKSSNTRVAKINNAGLATPVAQGKTKITATSSAALGGKAGSLVLTVPGKHAARRKQRSDGGEAVSTKPPVPAPATADAVNEIPEDDEFTGDEEIQKSVPKVDAMSSQRFTNADGTTPVSGSVVVETLTGLMWVRDTKIRNPAACGSAMTKTWDDAIDYVTCLNANNYLKYADWRLPTSRELKNLMNYGQTWLNNQGFRNVQARGYWSSATDEIYTSGPWYIGRCDGSSQAAGDCSAWPVRDAP